MQILFDFPFYKNKLYGCMILRAFIDTLLYMGDKMDDQMSRDLMTIANLYVGNMDVIDECFRDDKYNVRSIPGLILYYSTIDIMTWLGSSRDEAKGGDDFAEWSDKYLTKHLTTDKACRGVDLWGARCGLIHMASSKSKLLGQGKAEEIIYYKNPARPLRDDRIQLEFFDMRNALEKAIEEFLSEADNDPLLKDRILNKARKVLTHFPVEIVKEEKKQI